RELSPFILKATQHFLTRHPSPFYKPPHALFTGFSLAAGMTPHIAKMVGEIFPHLPASMHTFSAPASMNFLLINECGDTLVQKIWLRISRCALFSRYKIL